MKILVVASRCFWQDFFFSYNKIFFISEQRSSTRLHVSLGLRRLPGIAAERLAGGGEEGEEDVCR